MSRIFRSLERAESERPAQSPAPSVTDGLGSTPTPAQPRPPDPAHRAEYEMLARKIAHASSACLFKTVMVASPAHGEGTSTVASRLALALAEVGRPSVLVADANFRRPALHQLFHIAPAEGLAELISGQVALDGVARDTGTPNLHLITAGRHVDGAAYLLHSPRLRELLDQFQRAYDITILDAPPILPYADALALASRVDRVLLVTQAERTGREHLERATGELTRSGAAILGVVLNRTASHAPPWLRRRFNS